MRIRQLLLNRLIVKVAFIYALILPAYVSGENTNELKSSPQYALILHANESDENLNELMSSPLSDQSMDEVYGGFSTSNGNFIYFSMDFLKVRFLSQNEAALEGSVGFVGTLNQTAFINENGMGLDIQIVQAGISGGDDSGGDITNSINTNQNTPGGSPISLLNNSGFVNVNVVNGNYNTASIANVINIKVGFFQIMNATQIKPMFQDWLVQY